MLEWALSHEVKDDHWARRKASWEITEFSATLLSATRVTLGALLCDFPTRLDVDITRPELQRSDHDLGLPWYNFEEVMQDINVEEMEGVEMTGAEKQSPPGLTGQEKRILDVYDRLEELQLEIALLKAQGVLSQDEPMEVSEEEITAAQEELLKAKAAYQVRSNVIQSVLIANPILKAVHGGKNASIAEQDLKPLIQQRDDLSVALTRLSTNVLLARNELQKVESEHIVTARKNAELATTMLALAEEADTQRKDVIEDPKDRQQLDELEASMKTSRQRCRIMKGTASSTIAGSGIDWARDPKLLEIVLDNDGNEE